MYEGFEKVIAIDGPCGSGKSTISRMVANQLNAVYVDTGSMFRALGYSCDKEKIPFEDESQIKDHLEKIKFCYGESADRLVEINGENLTDVIRDHRVSELASMISKIPAVRDFLLKFQRELAQEVICVMEGRDIGTVVFPKAFCKIFLSASCEIRAQRRLDELKQKGETNLSFEEILADVKDRDERDMNREIAPLKQAEDAWNLDTSDLPIDEVVSRIKNFAITRANRVGLQFKN